MASLCSSGFLPTAAIVLVVLVIVDASQSPQWGGRGGDEFSDGLSRGIRQIQLRHGNRIDMIKVLYDQDGVRMTGGQHGGNGGSRVQITLDYPDEYLLQVSGTYDENINSLIFFTRRKSNDDRKQYGPFGKLHGNYFRTGQGKVVGLFGRASRYVDALGVYFEDPCRNSSRT